MKGLSNFHFSIKEKIRNNLKNHIDKKGLDLLGDRRPENISVIEYIDIFNKYFF